MWTKTADQLLGNIARFAQRTLDGHTTATQLLRAGAPLPEIRQLLRHRRALTTAIYAKIDRVALPTIVRPWPEGVV